METAVNLSKREMSLSKKKKKKKNAKFLFYAAITSQFS